MAEGVRASFMPKPFTEYPGSAMHTHMSLFEGDTNAFHRPDDPLQLSDRREVSSSPGSCEHAGEISAVTNQWVNSYKRLVHGGEAPTAVCWGRPTGRRWCGCRCTPRTRRRRGGSRCAARLGLQPLPDVRGAARRRLRGIEKATSCRPEAEDNVWTLTPRGAPAMGYRELPKQPRYEALDRRWRTLRAGRRGARRARLRLLPAQQARGVGEYRVQVSAYERDRMMSVL
jgi:glutamine synthetase